MIEKKNHSLSTFNEYQASERYLKILGAIIKRITQYDEWKSSDPISELPNELYVASITI